MLATAQFRAAIERGRVMRLNPYDIAVQLGCTLAEVMKVWEECPIPFPPVAERPIPATPAVRKPERPSRYNEDVRTMAELDHLIESQRATMPGWEPGEE